ncbi:putative protein N(5)-glutamine methyltransferase [Actinotalea fermentans]|uniref:peptide chain release factor N(5)-glutamine methyltransferase n=1 Tax=Actinotalea fermentans TaxID=43671 RepID=A0A511YWG5_9CELL|nr:putative protein N(5)-glutamine methyltransferase [Actinotalea fermentans]GEN79553.1 N5-glutamine S-adenosyl-L-methionine-dependent methyltransferase [Actinotalea fermentans]
MTDPTPEAVAATLRAAGCVFAEEEAALLLAAAPGGAALDRLVARRVSGEPLEQVLGWAELAGVRVHVTPGVFVPRRRSALLVREGATAARAVSARGRGAVVADLCCGTGAVGAALLATAGDAVGELHAADVDPAAVACARANLPHAQVHEGDLWDAFPAGLAGRLDVVVANAPYVPTDEIATMPPEARLHEARVALDGGADGLDLHRRIAEGAPAWLAPGGVLVLETSRRQADRTRAALDAAGLATRVVTDDDVAGTAVVGRRD